MIDVYELDDPKDATLGIDKLAHFGCSAVLWLVLDRVVASPLPWFVAAALAVELVEAWRYRRWTAKGKPLPWPPLTDKVSLKDLAADALGALVAVWL